MSELIVTIDTREPSSTAANFRSHSDVTDVAETDLETGDIEIGDVLIERKTPPDMASSILDNRLFQQARRLADKDHGIILLEGSLPDFAGGWSDLSPNAARGSIASIVIRTGVPVIPCSDALNLVDLAVRLGQKSLTEESTAFSHDHFETNTNVNPTIQMYATIPGVGPERAKTLYQVYPSVSRLCEATQAEIEEIDGFGEATAQTVVEAL